MYGTVGKNGTCTWNLLLKKHAKLPSGLGFKDTFRTPRGLPRLSLNDKHTVSSPSVSSVGFDSNNGAEISDMLPSEVDEIVEQMPSLVVFSGGTAFNSVAGHLRNLTTKVAHVLPVSDDGGSTAEIVRVLGGPAVGDIRSRCLRLADDSNEEAVAVKTLLAHRLSGKDSASAKIEWIEIVDGEHKLWKAVGQSYKHTIRAFLVYFNTQIQRHPERFNFRNGSVGNFFFAGARLFLCSMEAAIFLFSRVARIPEGSFVLPAIRTESSITLGAELVGGSIIRGQNQISHPIHDSLDRSLSGPHEVDKDGIDQPLPAAIRRVLYLSTQGRAELEAVYPPNPSMLAQLESSDAIIYGIGSLYTSICPSLILEGVGEAIANSKVPKILLLNGSHDRETSVGNDPQGLMTASDIVQVICSALNRDHSNWHSGLNFGVERFVTHVLGPANGGILVDREKLQEIGIREFVEVESILSKYDKRQYDPENLISTLQRVISPERHEVAR